jgi:(2R)-ethylmalonyl-CoA mutase
MRSIARTSRAARPGLSVAFDLPTQTGYDPDHPLAKGEVGKVGVPVSHLGDMLTLMDGLPLDRMNTSMTINATAPWLLALYIAAAEKQGVSRAALQGTVQNDIIKEYLSRGTYIFPPEPSLKLTTDVIAFAYREVPKWNPTNVCSYHLQEAGATPEQELAFALATAIAVLDRVKEKVPAEDLPQVVGRISFFVNAGLRFITELCKMRAFTELWDEITHERYGVEDAKLRRFRYGVQVNSLGLTEQQPENNVYRILLEMLAVTSARTRAPARCSCRRGTRRSACRGRGTSNGRCACSRSWRSRPTFLEYDDIFNGSKVIDAKVAELKDGGARGAEADRRDGRRGRRDRLELYEAAAGGIQDAAHERDRGRASRWWWGGTSSPTARHAAAPRRTMADPDRRRSGRNRRRSTPDCLAPIAHEAAVAALRSWKPIARAGRNVMTPPSPAPHSGLTTREWGATFARSMRSIAPRTGVARAGIESAMAI